MWTREELIEAILLEKKGWIQKANTRMEQKGTKGALSREAAAHGMSACAYARKLGRGNPRANFALNTGCRGKG